MGYRHHTVISMIAVAQLNGRFIRQQY